MGFPAANASLFHCEWRVLLSPGCPYVSELETVTRVAVVFLWVAAFILTFQLVVRWGFLRRKLILKKGGPLILNPMEFLFLGTYGHLLSRATQLTMLLYWKDPVVAPPVLSFFLSFAFFLPAVCMTYYWLALIRALPSEKITGGGDYIAKLMNVSTVAGYIFIGCATLVLGLETSSSAFIFTNQRLFDGLLTAVYSIWTVVMMVISIGISWYGMKIMKLMKSSVSSSDDLMKKSYISMKLGVNVLGNLTSSMSLLSLMLGFARYQIWSVPKFSILVYIFQVFPPAFTGFFLCTIFFGRDVYFHFKGQKDISRGATREKESTLNSSFSGMQVDDVIVELK